MTGWVHRLIRSTFFAALCVVYTAEACEVRGAPVAGEWRLTAVLDSSDVAAMDDEDAQRMVGQIVVIAPERTVIGTHVCGPSQFKVTRERTREHLREAAHASSDKLGLPDPVTVVQLSCTHVLVKTADSVVIYWDGYFFEAQRVQPTRR